MAFDIREEDEDHHHDEFDEYEDVKPTERPKFYKRRKFWYFCIPNAIVVLIVAVILALYVIMPKIAQGLMNKATINFDAIDITNPSATSMDIAMVGNMEHTGPFSADISFPDTVYVSWNGIELGTTDIPGTSKASGGHGSLNLASSFIVTNATAFTEFSSYMLNADSFVWHLQGKLNVKALSHTVKGLTLSKDITVKAFNGLSNIKIEKFSLPGDDPSGKGIIVEIDTSVFNPSSIQMYMGSLTLAISYKDVLMGYVTSSNLTMVRGQQTMNMKGVLIPQNTTEGLAVTSEMMSRYIGNIMTNTTATGVDVKPDGVNSLKWLSDAVKNLKLTVPLQSPTPLTLIKALNLGALGLVFTPPTAYEPITTSTGVTANYSLPDGFGFKIQFQQVSNTFALSRGGVTIANLNSSYNPSTSDMATSTLTFNLLATPLLVPDASHVAFQEFNRDLTVGADLPFDVVGQASVYANTSIGVVNLVNIPFNASTQLSGLQSLANPAPTITSLQVVSGSTTGLTMAISVIIVNPSSISLNAGDVVLSLMYKGVNLGTVTMPNLAIVPGANTVQTSSTIDPAKSPEGIELLNLYTSGVGAPVSIAGTPTSTAVESLSLAFGALNIETQMPGLQSKLLASASLVVLDTTIVNGLAQTTVTVNNPFVPPMTILSIDSKITYGDLSVGTVTSTFASPPVIPGTGQGTITAALAMNTNAHDLVSLIQAQAVKNGLSTAAFDGLLSLQTGGNPPASLFAGFNVADFTLKAMAGLVVDITMTTTVKVGDYQVTMPYAQTGVTTNTDQSLLKLLPIVGTPIAQVLVDQSILAFDAINILSPTDTSFQTDINGAISNTGPLDAQIAFPNPVVVSYDGKAIGSMMMPTVNATADKGAPLDLNGVAFTITDTTAYTDFTVFALNNAKFNWTISTTGVVVNAVGAPIPGVSMTKTVTLDGFNKLAGLQLGVYTIDTIDNEGLHLNIAASLQNPSTIGMVIPVSQFNTMYGPVVLGPAVVNGLALVPHSKSDFSLQATIAPNAGQDMTPILQGIFHNALSNTSTPMTAVGTGAPGVAWLDTAIKSLTLSTALPPLSAPPIGAVSIDAMSLDFVCDTCVTKPIASSSITATTNLPFKVAPIKKLSQNIQVLDKNRAIIGVLQTPYADCVVNGNTVSTTTPPSELVIDESALNGIYSTFIGDLASEVTYTLGLRGTADSQLDLGPFGTVEIKGIPLDVETPMAGLNNLAGMKYIYQVNSDFLSQPGFIVLQSIIQIHNPTNLTLNLGNLDLATAATGAVSGPLGSSTIANLTLSPGDNMIVSGTALDQSLPAGAAFLGSLFGGTNQNLVLTGFDKTSSNAQLNAGLAAMKSELFIPGGLAGLTLSQPPYLNWSLKTTPTTNTDLILMATATFQTPFYGFPLQMLSPGPGFSVAQVIGVSFTADGTTLFNFLDDLTYTVQGTEQVTVTFGVQMKSSPLTVDDKPLWQDIVSFGQTNGYIPVNFQLLAQMIFDNGIVNDFDLSNLSVGLPPTNIAVGADFASILGAFPNATPSATPSATSTGAVPSTVPSTIPSVITSVIPSATLSATPSATTTA
ncbi:hypothetical protein EMPS_07840 [Entomortierella parvispora]|uniref:Pre-rRNA processing protein n=1 Tax=Entomortierella parvispora TaxID=205924 RepID=A0A9P3HFP9_9FUNG|nr:hypothetical protein EMPS_07840 [Entomortierella parvispora]